MHKLLKLQLEKSGLSKAQMADMQDLIELIMQAYNGYDNDLSLLDNVCLLYTSPSPRDRG